MDLRQRRKEVENQITMLLGQVHAMDNKIRNYLADRQKNPHPRHEDLLERIQRFRIDPAISTKHLETMLENLQWKAYYHNQAWRQLWQNAEMKRKRERQAVDREAGSEGDQNGNREKDNRLIYSVDRLWEVQREKLDSLGKNAEPEAKDTFVSRIKKRYGQLASEKKDDEEIYMTFDPAEKRCTLEKRRKGE